jgi:hypothetical protein
MTTKRLILVPALISLGITLLRLTGELLRWSPTLFNRDAGGPGALIGIVWLVPILGVYFAVRLNRAGQGPSSKGKAIGAALLGVATFVLLYNATRLGPSGPIRLVLLNLASAVAGALAASGWPALGLTELAYGLAARVPVAIVMLLAMAGNWGTHYELGPPGLPELSLMPKWLLIGLMPQLVFWIGFTVVLGSLCGSLSLLFQGKTSRAAERGA